MPNLVRLLPWLIVLGVIGLNQKRHNKAWLVLLPLLAIWVVLELLTQSLRVFPSEMMDFFGAMALGLALVWLALFKLSNLPRPVSFLIALGLMAAVGALSILSSSEFSGAGVAMVVTLAIFSLIILVGMALAGWCCQTRFTPVRYIIWTLAWFEIFALILFGGFGLIMVGFGAPIMEILFGTLAVGALAFALVLPFLILAFASPFYRQHWEAILKPGKLAQTQS